MGQGKVSVLTGQMILDFCGVGHPDFVLYGTEWASIYLLQGNQDLQYSCLSLASEHFYTYKFSPIVFCNLARFNSVQSVYIYFNT